MTNKIEIISKGAEFSQCGKYRYALWRVWDNTKPLVMYIGLNPSTANCETNDPTIESVKRISAFNGYGGFYMMNLYGIISAKPQILKDKSIDPMGDNMRWHDEIKLRCLDVVFAWGNFKETKGVCEQFVEKYPFALCINKNKNGSPVHPLFQKGESKLRYFKEV